MIWFRNLSAYVLTEPVDDLLEQLTEHMPRVALRPCPAEETSVQGFSAALNQDITPDQLLYQSHDVGVLHFTREERLLPSGVIKELVDERRREIEARESRPVRAKERRELKEQITFELMPRAFIRRRRTRALLLPKERMFWVDSASAKLGDELTSVLRKAINHLPLSPLVATQSPQTLMTAWLTGAEPLPTGWALGAAVVLEDANGATVRARNYSLDSAEIRAHLQAGMLVKQIAVAWNERLEFTLSDDLTLRALRYADSLTEAAANEGGGDPLADADAEIALMRAELSELQRDLCRVFEIQ